MADGDGPRSDAIRAAVSALSLEKGFECAEKNTIEVLSETLKSCKCTSSRKFGIDLSGLRVEGSSLRITNRLDVLACAPRCVWL